MCPAPKRNRCMKKNSVLILVDHHNTIIINQSIKKEISSWMEVDLCNYKHGLWLSCGLLRLSSGFQIHMAQLVRAICSTARPLRQWKNIPGICSGPTFSLLNATALHTRYSFCSMFTVLLYDSVMIRSKWLLSPLEDSNCHKTLFGCSWSCPNKVKHHCRIVMSGLCPLVSPREMVLLSTLVAFFHHLFWAQ